MAMKMTIKNFYDLLEADIQPEEIKKELKEKPDLVSFLAN